MIHYNVKSSLHHCPWLPMNKIVLRILFKISTEYPITWWTIIWMTTWSIFVQYFVKFFYICCSVALLCLTLCYSRLPCPSLSPGACTNACPLSWWCHSIISSSLVPFSWLQSFPASGSFLMTQLFESSGQVLEFQLQHQSFQGIFRIDYL